MQIWNNINILFINISNTPVNVSNTSVDVSNTSVDVSNTSVDVNIIPTKITEQIEKTRGAFSEGVKPAEFVNVFHSLIDLSINGAFIQSYLNKAFINSKL